MTFEWSSKNYEENKSRRCIHNFKKTGKEGHSLSYTLLLLFLIVICGQIKHFQHKRIACYISWFVITMSKMPERNNLTEKMFILAHDWLCWW